MVLQPEKMKANIHESIHKIEESYRVLALGSSPGRVRKILILVLIVAGLSLGKFQSLDPTFTYLSLTASGLHL